MSVSLHLASVLRRFSDGKALVQVGGDSAAEALADLVRQFPELGTRLFDESGGLYPYLHLFRNGERLVDVDLTEVALADGDELDLVGIAEGGAHSPSDGGEEVPKALAMASKGDVRMKGFRTRSTVQEARTYALADLTQLPAENVPVAESAGRVLAAEVRSSVNVPPFRRAAMDGFAVRAADTFGASLWDPVALKEVGEVLPGAVDLPAVGPGEACRIMTGAPLPPGADAVLMAEDCSRDEAGNVLAHAALPPAKNVGQIGEDVALGEVLLGPGRVLRPQDAGILASIGQHPVPVVRRPRVRVIASGNELLPPGSTPRAGCIVDSNTPMLSALVQRDGGELEHTWRCEDEPGTLREALLAEGAPDVVLTVGGSSVGTEDWFPSLVREHGELPIHGVAMRPSAPTGIGRVGTARVILLPGNPVSCLCAYDFFAAPVLRTLAGRSAAWPYPSAECILTRRISSRVGRLDYVRMQVEGETARPLAISGAAVLSSTTRADGFAVVSADSEGLAEGERVSVFLYDSPGSEVDCR